MPIFEVRDANGVPVYQYRHTEKLTFSLYPEPPYTQVEVEEPVEPPPPPTIYGGRRVLTKREFLMLFTQQERIALRTVAKGNSQAAMMVEDYMFLLDQSQDVTLDHPDTIAGLQMLEAGGLLGAGRAAEILNG